MEARDRSPKNMKEKEKKMALTSVQKAELLKTWTKLKQQEYILEKGLVDFIDKMKANADMIQSLSKEEKELSAKRENVLSALHETIVDIDNDLKAAKAIVSDPEKIQTLDVNSFKVKLIGLSKKVDNFKKTCSLPTLIEEGIKLDCEIKEIMSRVDKYSTINTEVKSSTADVFTFDNEKVKAFENYEDVEDIHGLIAKTGHTQRWNNEDHLFFLKMRRTCKNVPALVRAVQTKCPDLSTETIINHEAWYKLYLDLREKQKLKVQEWRERRKMNRMNELKNKERVDKENIDDNIPANVPNKPTIKNVEVLNTNDDENTNKKELIKKWKEQKEIKRLAEEKQSKLRSERAALDEKRAKVRMERVRKTLQDYKNKKLEESSAKTREESKGTKGYDPTLMKEFRKQDEEYVRKRKVLLSRTTKTSKFLTMRKNTNNSNSSTLCKPTKAWNEKCKAEDSKTKDNPRYIKDVPKLYARWRNEESKDLQDLLK